MPAAPRPGRPLRPTAAKVGTGVTKVRTGVTRVRKGVKRMRTGVRDPLRFLEELARDHGDVGRVSLGWRTVWLFVHPEQVQEVLVARNGSFRGLELARPLLDDGLLSSHGDWHRRQRKLLAPGFLPDRVRGYAGIASGQGEAWSARWADGQAVDMADEMMRLTLEVTTRLVFGRAPPPEADALGRALVACLEDFRRSPVAPWTSRLPTPHGVRFARSRARVDALVAALLAQRRAAGAPGDDLLGMLLDARYDDGTGMDDKRVRDEALTLLVAGHETTALALTWAWHLLARNPEAQARLHAELDAALAGPPGLDDLPRLPYARQVLAEAMRLYPPVWAIGRKAVEDVEIGGRKVRRGSIVIVSPYLTQHDPRFWPEPERFDPGRFTPEAVKARPRLAYFPFGSGARVCLGEHLAWLEMTLLLASVARSWRVAPQDGRPVERHPLLTLQPRGGLPLRVHARAPPRGKDA